MPSLKARPDKELGCEVQTEADLCFVQESTVVDNTTVPALGGASVQQKTNAAARAALMAVAPAR